jgi:hypothetical protein
LAAKSARPPGRAGETKIAKASLNLVVSILRFAVLDHRLKTCDEKSLIDVLYQALCLLRLRFYPFWNGGQSLANFVRILATAKGQMWRAAAARA